MRVFISAAAIRTPMGTDPLDPAGTLPWQEHPSGARWAEIPVRLSEVWPDAPPRLQARDRASGLGFLVVRDLLARAPLTSAQREGCALLLGTAMGCGHVNDRYHRALLHGRTSLLPALFGFTVPSAPVGAVATELGFRGEQHTQMAGRCSGAQALAVALRGIERGRYERALVFAGDALGADRAQALHALGRPPAVETWVALLLEASPSSPPLGTLDKVDIRRVPVEPGAAPTMDALGASGLDALVAALARAGAPIHLTVTDPCGLQAVISATPDLQEQEDEP